MRGVMGRATLAAVLAIPSSVGAWGCDAHSAVAYVALGAMSSRARAAVDALLEANPIDPSLRRFCKPRTSSAFVDASTWADDLRERRPDTGPWHYVNVPLDAGPDESPAAFCPSRGCLTSVVRSELDRLRSSRSDVQRADALRLLVHFVADLHQPLHAADNGDRGGNCVGVAYFGDRPRWVGEKLAPNLHGVWDSRLVDTLLARDDLSVFEWARRLGTRHAARIPAWRTEPVDVDRWAMETRRVAVDVAYGAFSKKIPVAPRVHARDCRDRDVGDRMLALGLRVDDAYVAKALPVVEEQLAKAGARLAGMLDTVWP